MLSTYITMLGFISTLLVLQVRNRHGPHGRSLQTWQLTSPSVVLPKADDECLEDVYGKYHLDMLQRSVKSIQAILIVE